MKILIVERDYEEIKGIEWYLKNYLSEQVEIESETNTMRLEEVIVAFQPTVIIMETELMNPHIQSILKKHHKHMIALTSSPIFQQAVRAIEVNALQLFVKPIPLEKLKSTLLTLPEKTEQPVENGLVHFESQLYFNLYLNTPPSIELQDYSFILMEPETLEYNLELYNWFIQLPVFNKFKAVPLQKRVVCLIQSNDFVQIEKQLRIIIQEWKAISGRDMNIAVYSGDERSITGMYEACKKALSQRFYKGYGHIFKSDYALPITRLDPLLTPEEQQLWIESLENSDLKKIKHFFYRLTNADVYFHNEDVRIHLTSILAQIRRFMMKYHLHEQPTIEAKYRQLFHLILHHPILYEIVQDFILYIQMLMETIKNSAYQGHVDYVEMAVQIIEKRFSEANLSLNTVAIELNISSNYLSNIFSKKRGIPFKKYLQQYRLQKAEKLLINTNLTISEIAQQVGFVDSNYFTKVFKEYFRLTPLKYRGQKQKAK